MPNYKIKVNMEIVECDEPAAEEPAKIKDGKFEFNITEKQAGRIDDCEQALLRTNYEAMRDLMTVHLTELSKKNRRRKRGWQSISQSPCVSS